MAAKWVGGVLALVMLLAGCGRNMSQSMPSAVQPTATPSATKALLPTHLVTPTTMLPTSSLTDTIRSDLWHTFYDEPPASLHTIIHWLSQGKEAQRIVAAELASYDTHLPPTQPLTGTMFAESDVNLDGTMELLFVKPGEPQIMPGVLGLVALDATNQYTLTATATVGGSHNTRIQEIADINQDGQIEIVVQGAGCAPRFGCRLNVRVFQWHEHKDELTEVLWTTWPGRDDHRGATMNSAQATLADQDGDGIQEIMLTGGDDTAYTDWLIQVEGDMPDPYRGGAIGPQRTCSIIYAWDGTRYLPTERICDPDASQHPWFRLRDGDDALAAGDFATAVALYRDALSRPHPQDVRFDSSSPQDQARLFVVLRFRLLLTLVLQGEPEQAAVVAQEAQVQDGNLAGLTQAFWDAYEQSDDVQTGCAAAQAVADTLEDQNIRGYGHRFAMPSIARRICRDTDPLPDSS